MFVIKGFYYRAIGLETMIGYKYTLDEKEEIIEEKYWIIR